MEKHGTASLDAGQFAEFASVVIRQLPRDLDSTTVQGWIENQSSLQRVLREALMPIPIEQEKNVFPVTVDYTRTLSDMISAGHYDSVNDDITADHFPVSGEGVVEVKLELVHFDRVMESDDVLKELDKDGLRPATLAELLAFGAKYPDIQRQFPIIALGAVWQNRRGYRSVPALWGSSIGRFLDLHYFDDGWDGYYRFLAVLK
ncbi:MAG: hypothetical protein AAB911_02465 [Patescibacteria group bacterium]|mgnify:FL=1